MLSSHAKFGLRLLLICLAATVFLPVALYPGTQEKGIPFIRTISAQEYDSSNQVWAVEQDTRGVLYFACAPGEIVEYDGVTWRKIKMPGPVARSLTLHVNGTIYAGGDGELGYLEPDETGQMTYVSLKEQLPPKERDFRDVWDVLSTPEGIYFYSYTKIMRRQGGKFKTWRLNGMGTPHYVDGSLYVAEVNTGAFLRLRGDILEEIDRRPEFAKGVLAMLPIPGISNQVLICPWMGRFKPYNLDTFEYTKAFQVPEKVNRFLEENTLYNPLHLPDGRTVLNTLKGGCMVVDANFRTLRLLNEDSGLKDNTVTDALVDRDGGLWLTHANGLSHVEFQSPLTLFSKESSGLQAGILDIIRYRGTLYIGTFVGAFYLEEGRFKPVEGSPAPTWGMRVIDGRLVICGMGGVFAVENNRARLLLDTIQAFYLYQSPTHPAHVFVTHDTGVILTRQEIKNNRLSLKVIYRKDTPAEVRRLFQDSEGNLWIGTQEGGIMRALLDEKGMFRTIHRCGATYGLPEEDTVGVTKFMDQVIVDTSKGLFSFNPAKEQFEPADELSERLGTTGRWISGPNVDPQGAVWMWERRKGKYSLLMARPKKDTELTTFELDDSPFKRFLPGASAVIYHETGGVTWIGGHEGLYRYDGNIRPDNTQSFKTLIRGVRIGSDRNVFHGTYFKRGGENRIAGLAQPDTLKGTYPFEENNILVQFAALSFSAPKDNRYSLYLEGHGRGWSGWTAFTEREYSNLWEGAYTLHVKAKDIYGRESEPASYSFTISAPWYRTFWAYTIYALLVIAVFYGGARLYSRRLEKLVRARTAEISRQKEALESQAKALKAANEEAGNERELAESANRSKSQFLARMSHEIRTPMNGVIGFAEMLMDTPLSEEQRDYVNTIQRSGDALISVINDILDFSRIEAGELSLDCLDFDPEMTVYDVCEMVLPRLESKPVELMCRIGDHVPAFVCGDAGRFRQVLLNLVSNAGKFTEEGEIEVSMDTVDERTDERGTYVKLDIRVRDTGIGIPSDKLATIFDAFQQADGSIARRYGGTGLGLPICKEIALLMNGGIKVESQHNRGSEFQFTAWMKKSGKKSESKFQKELLQGKRVLVVDDNPTNLEILTHALERYGMRPLKLSRADEVLPAIDESFRESDPVDICVIDIRLHHAGGLDVAREIRDREGPVKDLPLLAFSSSVRSRAAECRAAGFNGYLPKPTRRRRMIKMLERLLQRRQIGEELEAAPLLTQHTIREDDKQSTHILLAEDNAVSRKLAVHMLTRGGYRVTAVSNGQEAVDLITAHPEQFQLVFMDVQMPRMNGREATRLIRESGITGTPIIAMTAESFREDRDKCLEAGMNDYISKPVRREITFKMIKKWVKSFEGNGPAGQRP